MKRRPSFDDVLTPRERDCLRLLGQGLSTADVATDLGIRKSTLESHLAAARRKLSVSTTRQAVVVLQDDRSPEMMAHPQEQVLLIRAQLSSIDSHLPDLQGATSLAQAWRRFCRAMEELGVAGVNFGVIAEPEAVTTVDNWYFRSSLPHEVSSLYLQCGGVATDPNVPRFACSRAPFLIDAASLKGQFSTLPPSARRLATSMLDHHLTLSVCAPLRDETTRALMGAAFVLDPSEHSAVQRHRSERTALLQSAAVYFAACVRNQRLLSDIPGLTQREVAALKLLVRGFSMQCAAERSGLSQRGYEKVLAVVRAKLGARTNAQAVYRAMVYRAL